MKTWNVNVAQPIMKNRFWHCNTFNGRDFFWL